MDVGGKLREIESIERELGLIKARRGDLVRRRDLLMNDLILFHKERGVEFFEYKGKRYYIKDQQVPTRKRAADKAKDVAAALEKHGLYGDDARRVYECVMEQVKGEPKTKTILK